NLKMKKGMYMRLKTKGLIAIFILVIVLSACSSKNEVVISGKPWTEQYILPYILGGVIEENTDYDVKYEEGLGEVAILTPALDKGEIDLYVEYTGTGLKDVLEEETEPGESPDSVYDRVKKGYDEEFDVKWLEPLGFENAYTLTYAPDSGYEAETISELAEISQKNDMVFGAPHPFYERVEKGHGRLTTGYTTERRIEKFDLVTTEDDKDFFPMYDAVPIIRKEALEDMPELEDAINKLAGEISEEEMLKMNARVDIDEEKPEDVANDFLVRSEEHTS